MLPLVQLLGEEKRLVEKFIALLALEQDALTKGAADELPLIVNDKKTLVEALNSLETTRASLISSTPQDSGNQAMERWLSIHPDEKSVANLWREILKLAAEAKQQHALNGRLINMHLTRTSEALNILTQRQQYTGLYGSDGQATSGSGSRIVDSA